MTGSAVRSLDEQATDFATQITHTVAGVIDGADPFVATVLDGGRRRQFTVRQSPETGIALPMSEGALVTLTARFKGALDKQGHYLRVETSAIKVYFGEAGGQPLFRYEYDGLRRSSIPRAHLQVGDQQDLAALASLSGEASRTARHRAGRIESGMLPRSDHLHFPVGGDRFRPSLEDVLEMLVEQLGVPALPDWRNSVAAGRRAWRTTQLRAAVRDHPQAAADALAEAGYTVDPPPEGHPPPSEERLTLL
jgi:hypothetical protein